MNDSSCDAHWRQRLLLYCQDHGPIETAIRYRQNRKSIWKWQCRWVEAWESLLDQSRRPHNSPGRQSRSEEELVKQYGEICRLGSRKQETMDIREATDASNARYDACSLDTDQPSFCGQSVTHV